MTPVADRVVEGTAPAGRVDVAVASVAEISRAHAQRLIGDGRALVAGILFDFKELPIDAFAEVAAATA